VHGGRLASEAGARRILFPFVAAGLSQSALDPALRLARAENATLVPAFLARVPMQLPHSTRPSHGSAKDLVAPPAGDDQPDQDRDRGVRVAEGPDVAKDRPDR
jgi:hypothetical protein